MSIAPISREFSLAETTSKKRIGHEHISRRLPLPTNPERITVVEQIVWTVHGPPERPSQPSSLFDAKVMVLVVRLLTHDDVCALLDSTETYGTLSSILFPPSLRAPSSVSLRRSLVRHVRSRRRPNWHVTMNSEPDRPGSSVPTLDLSSSLAMECRSSADPTGYVDPVSLDNMYHNKIEDVQNVRRFSRGIDRVIRCAFVVNEFPLETGDTSRNMRCRFE
jgi:hypothetical protein